MPTALSASDYIWEGAWINVSRLGSLERFTPRPPSISLTDITLLILPVDSRSRIGSDFDPQSFQDCHCLSSSCPLHIHRGFAALDPFASCPPPDKSNQLTQESLLSPAADRPTKHRLRSERLVAASACCFRLEASTWCQGLAEFFATNPLCLSPFCFHSSCRSILFLASRIKR